MKRLEIEQSSNTISLVGGGKLLGLFRNYDPVDISKQQRSLVILLKSGA